MILVILQGVFSLSYASAAAEGRSEHISALEENMIPRHCALKPSSKYAAQLEAESI